MTTERMSTESGLEEFVLYVQDGFVWTIQRDDGQDRHKTWAYEETLEYNIVKAYAPIPVIPKWLDEDDVIIGYCERRLTEVERQAVIKYVARYWDIPF